MTIRFISFPDTINKEKVKIFVFLAQNVIIGELDHAPQLRSESRHESPIACALFNKKINSFPCFLP